MKIMNIVGARPNFMKIAPILREMKKYPSIKPLLIHTGQHYDPTMSKLFFEDLNIPKPNIHLGIGSGTHAEQTGNLMIALEKVFMREMPDIVLVVGDVNSTLATALTAVKLHIPVAHVEAGLRSFDRNMPEEINRVLTDAISDILFITEISAKENLLKEALPAFERIMIEVALARTGGRRQDAARLLGWGRNTLTRKIKELDMDAG